MRLVYLLLGAQCGCDCAGRRRMTTTARYALDESGRKFDVAVGLGCRLGDFLEQTIARLVAHFGRRKYCHCEKWEQTGGVDFVK